MKPFSWLLIASLLIAAAAFMTPLWLNSFGFMLSLKLSVFVALLWGSTVAFALVRFRKRGLWLLFGAPPALFWSFVFTWLLWQCSHDFKGLCG